MVLVQHASGASREKNIGAVLENQCRHLLGDLSMLPQTANMGSGMESPKLDMSGGRF